jgi:hypothetical protein
MPLYEAQIEKVYIRADNEDAARKALIQFIKSDEIKNVDLDEVFGLDDEKDNTSYTPGLCVFDANTKKASKLKNIDFSKTSNPKGL